MKPNLFKQILWDIVGLSPEEWREVLDENKFVPFGSLEVPFKALILKTAGFEPKEVSQWLEKFGLTDAVEWKVAGFALEEALRWASAVDMPEQAWEEKATGYDLWEVAGFNKSDSAKWKAKGFSPFQAKLWRTFGFSLEESFAWSKTQANTPFGSVGFNPFVSLVYRTVGFTPEEAKKWEEYLVDKLQMEGYDIKKVITVIIASLKVAGFSLEELKELYDKGNSLTEALKKRISAHF